MSQPPTPPLISPDDLPEAPGTRQAQAALARLLAVMAHLRSPQGCPWDQQQTHASLSQYLLEETHEAQDAIDQWTASKDSSAEKQLTQEMGDVLLQVVFHAQLAQERGAWGFAQVAQAVADKMVARHPQVFAGPGTSPAPSSRPQPPNSRTPEGGGQEVGSQADGPPSAQKAAAHEKNWHQLKMADRHSHLEGIPRRLPQLRRAAKVAKAAARAGFDWSHSTQILDKTAEELSEFRAEAQQWSGSQPNTPAGSDAAVPPPNPALEDRMRMELGDLLFALVQLARWHHIDPEDALGAATDKFIRRFQWMEAQAKEHGQSTDTLDAQAWWALWKQAKNHHLD